MILLLSIEQEELSDEEKAEKYLFKSSYRNTSNSQTTYYNTFKKHKNDRFYIFKPLLFKRRESFLAMDYHSKRNLELISSIRNGRSKRDAYYGY